MDTLPHASQGLGPLPTCPYAHLYYECEHCHRKQRMEGPPPCDCRQHRRYKAMRVLIGGEHFDSLSEGRRWSKLIWLLSQGIITDLERQPKFVIEVAGHVICRYYADFRFRFRGAIIVEDVKGKETPVFRLKLKLLAALFPNTYIHLIPPGRK